MKAAKFTRGAWFALLVSLSIFGISACGSDDEEKPNTTLEANAKELFFEGKSGASQRLAITSDANWEITQMPDWLWANATKGTGSRNVDFYTTTSNMEMAERSSIVVIEAEGKTLTITVTQAKVETTLEADLTELEFEGTSTSSEYVTITSNRAWEATSCPEWISMSKKSGEGTTEVRISPTSTNSELTTREGEIVITSDDKTISIAVRQKSQYADCSATVENTTIMGDSFYADLAFSSNTVAYAEAYFNASSVKTATDQQIYNEVKKETHYNAAYNFTQCLIPAETEVLYCVIPITTVDGKDAYGPMTKFSFTTKSAATSSDALIPTLAYTSTKWRYMVDKQTDCAYYYTAYFTDEMAEDISNDDYPSAYIAYLLKGAIGNGLQPDTEGGLKEISRESETGLCVCTWGVSGQGEFSGNIQSAYKSANTASSHKQAAGKGKKRADGLRPGKKLTRQQIEAHKKKLHLVKVTQ